MGEGRGEQCGRRQRVAVWEKIEGSSVEEDRGEGAVNEEGNKNQL